MEKFIIETPSTRVSDLKARLRCTLWPPAATRKGWSEGTDLTYLKKLTDYWRDEFSWKSQEACLNKLAQYRVEVEGLKLHFIHERGKGTRPLPLLLIHGWPSSFAEMTEIIPLLTDPETHGGDPVDSFDVIVPSLPGHGYSDIPREPGMSIWAAADFLRKLMTDVLGYSRFFVSGGDWGAYAASYLAFTYPQEVAAIHLSFIPGGLSPAISSAQRPYDQSEMNLLAHRKQWVSTEGGYEHLQGTKPQTIAYALSDSPVGLAAWILEKMYTWTDCQSDLETVFSKDQLLTNISVYWFTQTIGSSMRLYFETREHAWDVPAGDALKRRLLFHYFQRN